jgi:hypothetical protein
MSKRIKNSVMMADDVMTVIKGLAKEMHSQVAQDKKANLHSKVDKVLQKMQKDAQKQNTKKNSILDLDLLNLNTTLKKPNKNKIEQDQVKENISHEELSEEASNVETLSISEQPSNLFQAKNKEKPKDFYAKQLEYQNKHELKMNHLKMQQLDVEMDTMKIKPGISINSKKILKKKNRVRSASSVQQNEGKEGQDYRPFFVRSQEVYQEQEERKEKLRKMYEMIKRAKDNRENPDILHHKKSAKFYREEEFEKWRNDKIKWQERKQDRTIELKKNLNNRDAVEYDFNPQLNQNSKKMVFNKYQNCSFNDRNQHFQDCREQNKMKIKNDINPNFRPVLQKDMPSYLRKDKVEEFKTHKNRSVGKYNNINSLAMEYENENGTNLDHDDVVEVLPQDNELKHNNQTNLNNEYNLMTSYHNNATDNNNFSMNMNKQNYTNNFYNLNVRDNAAWNENKENCVILNSGKYSDIIGKLVDVNDDINNNSLSMNAKVNKKNNFVDKKTSIMYPSKAWK